MGSRKKFYKIKATGQIVIPSGWSMRATSSETKACNTYELLNQDYEPTGETVQVSPDELEELPR